MKNVFLALILLISASGFAANPVISLDTIRTNSATQVEESFDIHLSNAGDVWGVQMIVSAHRALLLDNDSFQLSNARVPDDKGYELVVKQLCDTAFLLILSPTVYDAQLLKSTDVLIECSFSLTEDLVEDIPYPITISEILIVSSLGIRGIYQDAVHSALIYQSSPQLRGDVNSDGEVTISDAIEIVNVILAGNESTLSLAVCDANGDGEITISDAIEIVNWILRGAI